MVEGVGTGAPEFGITWQKDWSPRKLPCLDPAHLEGANGGTGGSWSYLDVLSAHPLRVATAAPHGPLGSLTWAEATALLGGALEPFLRGAGNHPCSFLRLCLHTLVLLFFGTTWLLEQT